MLNSFRRESGHVIFYQGENHTAKRLTFYDAVLVGLICRFDARGRDGNPSLETELYFSAAAENIDGQHIEAHSLIPWESNSPTSYRALTKPADPPPSPHLRAIFDRLREELPPLIAIPPPPTPNPPAKSIIGRTGKQEQLRGLLENSKVSSSIKGWITQDINEINRDKRKNIRNPPGLDLAHERGREAAKGYSYQYSNLQNRDLHRRQHRFDNKGRRNRERPDPELDNSDQ
jgi:hypothetical protein